MGWRERYRQWCDGFYWRAAARLIPDVRNSQYEYVETVESAFDSVQRWLDLGCGHGVLPPWVVRRQVEQMATRAYGIDMDFGALRRHATIRRRAQADIENLPFQSGRFQLVTANMVVEHVRDTQKMFEEVCRILAPGGRFIVHTPNLHGYTTLLARIVPKSLRRPLAGVIQDRVPEDVYRTYYRANTTAALRELGRVANLAPVRLSQVLTSPQLLIVPPVLVAEMLLMRALSWVSLRHFRPCILAVFEKRG